MYIKKLYRKSYSVLSSVARQLINIPSCFLCVLVTILKMGKKNVTVHRRRDRQNSSSAPGSGNDLKKYRHDYSKDYDPNWSYQKGKMDLGAKITLLLFPLAIFAGVGYVYYQSQLKEMVRQPLDVPNIISDTAVSAAEDPDRFWGSYRSNVYFGMKTRSPKSPVFGEKEFFQAACTIIINV